MMTQDIMDGQLGDRESSDPKMLNLRNVITECAGTEDPWHRDAAAFPQWWLGCIVLAAYTFRC